MKFEGFGKLALIFSAWLMLLSMNASAQTDSVDVIEINKRPLQDFALSVLDKWEKEEIDLTKSFTVELEGSLTGEGRFDLSVTRFTVSEGDEDIVETAKSSIEAVGDSGILVYLTNIGVGNIRMSVSQDESDTSLQVISEMESNARARTAASGLSMLMSFAVMDRIRTTADEKTLLKYSSVKSEETRMILKFKMPKQAFHEMVNRNLQKWSKMRPATNK
jgi:hypothetical protein